MHLSRLLQRLEELFVQVILRTSELVERHLFEEITGQREDVKQRRISER